MARAACLRAAPPVTRILLYELNEVPWEIVDLYRHQRPKSALAALLPRAMCLTTVSEERTIDLQPWRSWPTLHRSMWTRDHNSWDLGQDPDTFRGVDLWTAAARAGKRVGVFGALQSGPAQRFAGGFHVPDTFARTAATHPASLRRFQAFNLTMTAENRFAAGARLPAGQLLVAGADMLRLGLTPASALRLARHLVAERIDPAQVSMRPVMQVVPGFDLFWRLHRRHAPDLSVFFTNHVASMLHRYWADALPLAGASHGPGAKSVLQALDIFDRQLSRMLGWQRRSPDRVLVIASSMGQERVEKHELGRSFVVEDTARLAVVLGIDQAEVGVGMYPAQSLTLPTTEDAQRALKRLGSVEHAGGPMFRHMRQNGRSVSFEVDYLSDAGALPASATFAGADGTRVEAGIAELGIQGRIRPSGGNTGEHTTRGIFIAAGTAIRPDPARREVSVLDVAPSLLALLGVPPDVSMAGQPSLFE